MSTITTRTGKGSPLTNAELDANFTNLNKDKYQAGDSASFSDASLGSVNAESLHRSPNAVTAMFIYDTSKDSDGGAWTEKCQHTSWYNETLNGKWLGAQPSETNARYEGATLGSELFTNTTFSSTSGWTAGGGWSISNGVAVGASTNDIIYSSGAQAQAGKLYRLELTIASKTAGGIDVRLNGTSIGSPSTVGTHVFYAVAGSVNTMTGFYGTSSFSGTIDNVSLREVTATSTAAGDYFQLTTDGKFYSLNKNLLTSTATLATQTRWLTAGTYTLSSTTASSGSVAVSGAATASHTAGGSATTFTVATSGSVTFTVTGSVTTAQCELGSAATTYQANASTSRVTETFRGNKAKFPKLAGIVAESSNVTIYDLTEPGRPMFWRDGGLSSGVTALSAANGLLALCKSGEGLAEFDFGRDVYRLRYRLVSSSAYASPSLAGRQAGRKVVGSVQSGYGIASETVNAVAMTVLPDAPVDPVTGLQVPTIAVATAGGVSVIKHNGTVVSSSKTGSIKEIGFIGNDTLIQSYEYDGVYYSLKTGSLVSGFSSTKFDDRYQFLQFSYGAGQQARLIGNSIVSKTLNAPFFTRLVKNNSSNALNSLYASFGVNFADGYKCGKTVRSYLASSTVESLTQSQNLLPTATSEFTDASKWETVSGWVIDVNAKTLTATGTSNQLAVNYDPLPANRLSGWIVAITVDSVTSGSFKIYIGGTASSKTISTAGTHYLNFSTEIGYVLIIKPTSFSGVISRVYVYSAEPDRSYKQSAAYIYGTLTKSTVATNAQLVAYSGFSS